MTLSPKQKKGIGYIISGAVSIALGSLTLLLPQVPAVAVDIIQIVVFAAGVFGVTVFVPGE